MITLKDITPIKKVEIRFYSNGVDYFKPLSGIQFHAFMLHLMRNRDYEEMHDLIKDTAKFILENVKDEYYVDNVETFEIIWYDEQGYKYRLTK